MTTRFRQDHFKALKYHPELPKRFETINDARIFCRRFAAWYDEDHHHSGIGLMTPDQIHFGQADTIHAARQAALDAALPSTPERFVANARNHHKSRRLSGSTYQSKQRQPKPELKTKMSQSR